MSGFANAARSFRAAATQELGTSDIACGPNSEAVAMEFTIGPAWAFSAAPTSDPTRTFRGWALADGTVISPKRELGRLLEAAGAWSVPRGEMSRLPAALAWAMGSSFVAAGAPEVALAADGTGTVSFVVTRQSGGGGGSLTPQSTLDGRITIGAGHVAALEWIERPSADPGR